jgi:hypothetical protein
MHTKDILAGALHEAGLDAMADKAAEGYYHDFLSPLATPAAQLDQDLLAMAAAGNLKAFDIRTRQHNGEFDATLSEIDDSISAYNWLITRDPETGAPPSHSADTSRKLDVAEGDKIDEE